MLMVQSLRHGGDRETLAKALGSVSPDLQHPVILPVGDLHKLIQTHCESVLAPEQRCQSLSPQRWVSCAGHGRVLEVPNEPIEGVQTLLPAGTVRRHDAASHRSRGATEHGGYRCAQAVE